jgi:hypothetical protein
MKKVLKELNVVNMFYLQVFSSSPTAITAMATATASTTTITMFTHISSSHRLSEPAASELIKILKRQKIIKT